MPTDLGFVSRSRFRPGLGSLSLRLGLGSLSLRLRLRSLRLRLRLRSLRLRLRLRLKLRPLIAEGILSNESMSNAHSPQICMNYSRDPPDGGYDDPEWWARCSHQAR